MGDILQIGAGQWLCLHPDGPAINMALVTGVEPTHNGGVAVHTLFKSSSDIYHGDEAERIRAWLRNHGELPVLAHPPAET